MEKKVWYQRKRWLVAEVLLFLVAPVMWMRWLSNPAYLRFGLMSLGVAYYWWLLKKTQHTRVHLGISRKNYYPGAITSYGISLVLAALFFGIYWTWPAAVEILKVKISGFAWPLWVVVVSYIVVSVPLQEFIFRGLLISRLEMVFRSKGIIMLVNGSLFGLAHAIFGSNWFVAATFLLGVFWSWLFLRYRNLLVILPSHALVGAVFIVLHHF